MNKIRLYENFHVVLWLIKDSCWLLQLKWLGMTMAIPTLTMAIYICYLTRKNRAHFIPNMAVALWLSANITWMSGEFFGFSFLLPALLLFGSGLILMAWYFVRHRKSEAPQT